MGLPLALLFQVTLAASDPAMIVRDLERAAERGALPSATQSWRRSSADVRLRVFALATAARFAYQYDEAEQLYAAAAAGGRADRITAYSWLGTGQAHAARARYLDAERSLEYALRAARAAGARDGEAEALLALSTLRVRTTGAEAAKALVDSAATLIGDGDAVLEARRLCASAFVHVRLATRGVRDTAMAGARLAERVGESRTRAACLFALAQELEREGSFDSARTILREQLEPTLRRSRHRHSLAAVLQWDGYLLSRVGAFADARQRYTEALQEAQVSRHDAVLAWTHTGLAYLAELVGDYATALTHARSARALFAAQRDRWGLATVRGLEADALLAQGALDQAHVAYRETIDSVMAIGNSYSALERYRSLITLELERRNWTAAERWLADGDRITRGRSSAGWVSERELHAALIALGRGKLDDADSMLARVIETRSPRDTPPGIWLELLSRHAQVLARRGRSDSAELRLEQASQALDDWRAKQGSDKGYRMALLEGRQWTGRVDMGAASAVAVLARAGRISSALRFAEERRARELLTRLAQREAAESGTSMSGSGGAFPSVAPVATLEEVQRALLDSTALVQYLIPPSHEAMVALVITRTDARAVVLPPMAALAEPLRRLTTLVARGDSAVHLAAQLGQTLLKSPLAVVNGRVNRVILVPDGDLHRVPFEVLRSGNGRPLLSSYALSVVPSASALVALRRREAPGGGATTLLAFADPSYASRDLPRLPHSAREVRSAARHFDDAVLLLRSQATESALLGRALDRVRVMHFATHALVDDRVTWRSALALSPTSGDDGRVTPAELATLRLDAHLIVLSGCRTADGTLIAGEGIRGLTAPFLEAGARAVLATRWAVGDRDIVPVMEAFYAAMARGMTAGDALRLAQLDAMERRVSPAVWGALTLTGDAAVRPLARRTTQVGAP